MKRQIGRTISRIFALGNAGRLFQRGDLRILMYHAVGTAIPEDTQGRYTITPQAFSQQMTQLAGMNYGLVSLGAELPKNGIAVSFDDGYKDNLVAAYPILKALGIPFTIFVSACNLDSTSDIFLTRSDLQFLAKDPLVTIGAHGLSHTPLRQLRDADLARELIDSRSIIEDVIDKPVHGMSYPHGDYDQRIIEAVMQAGYLWAACSTFGCNTTTQNRFLLRRTDIWSYDSMRDFECKLAGGWDWLKFAQ